MEVNGRYTDRVLPGVGLCVLLYDLLKVGEAVVHPSQGFASARRDPSGGGGGGVERGPDAGDGAAWVKVEFREVVFRPFPNETLAGQVCRSVVHPVA